MRLCEQGLSFRAKSRALLVPTVSWWARDAARNLLYPVPHDAPFLHLRASGDSDDDGFVVFAEDAAEGVGDFADGGVGFDGGEDGGHEIFGGAGAAFEFGEGRARFCGVAPGAERLQARDLRALDFGVDAQRGNGALLVRLDSGLRRR